LRRDPLDEGGSTARVDRALGEPATFIGRAGDQVDPFVAKVVAIADRHPEAAAYAPAPIL